MEVSTYSFAMRPIQARHWDIITKTITQYRKSSFLVKLLSITLYVMMMLISGISQGQVAAWTFDATVVAPNTPLSVTANLGTQTGTATLYANGTNGSSAWLQSTELTAFAGNVLNDPRGTPVAGVSYSPLGGTSLSANGKGMVLKFSMTSLQDPILTFATRGTSTGFSTHQWAWSTDNITYTNFGTNTAVTTTTYLLKTLDMSAINTLDNAGTVYLKITFSGATGATGNNRLDNIVINATAAPSCAVTGSGTTTAPTCFGSSDGTAFITLAGLGAGAPGTYTVDGGGSQSFASNPFTVTGLTAGNHTVVATVTAGGCVSSDIIVSVGAAPSALTTTFTKTMVSSCGGGADGTITVTPAGGTGPYAYNWTSTPGGFSGNTAIVTGLTPRDYTVVVSDANGCSATIPDITIFQVFATVVTNNGGGSGSCANTGYILLYGSGGVQPYTYSIDGTNYFASNSFTALAAGTYTGYVKDLGGCVSTKPNIIVTGAAPIVVTAFTRPATSCSNNGSIELYRTGGMPSFTYSLDDITYQGGNTFNNLAGATTYTGWVKDAAGCKTSLANIAISTAPSITVSVTKLNTSPCSNSGSLVILAGGGVPGYTYSITGPNGTYQASNAFTGLAVGSYDVWVQDSKGCKQSNFSNVIGTNAAPTITVTAYPRSASSCANNGSIELYRNGGSGPFTYSLDNITYQASNTFTGLTGGTFTGWVKDVNGCSGSLAGIIVTQSPAVTVTENHTNTSTCINDGTFQLTPGGGVPGFTYSLDNITYQAGNSFTGLAAGIYTGWTKDSKGCTASVPVTIGTNAAIVVTAFVTAATNCETINGSIQLFRTGGTSPFTFSLNNVTYQAGNVFSGLLSGSYTGYIKDSKGCIGTLANIVVGPNCALPAPGVFTKNSAINITGNTVLKASVFPNPSASEFTLVLTGNSNEKVIINVTDIMGRNIYNVIENSKQQIRFGNNFKPGIYTIQVSQGDQKQTIKLIKE